MPIIIPEFENLYLSLYLMAELATHPYTKWQKSRPIAIPELKSCDPSERHLRTSHFLGVNPPELTVVKQAHWSMLRWLQGRKIVFFQKMPKKFF